ncbi:MAG TPA: arsenite efflux transporter metallochaperone ArsD [Pirellulales bacterium]|nr:arsenite efflux transporter metallochaperone ArsD [Pirellulales bacterium]
MTLLQVFDRPMCCPTGLCGPNIDPVLPRFAADLDWLKGQGVAVERYNLAQQASAFTAHPDVQQLLARYDVKCLPLIRVDGRVVGKGVYASREMLARWCGLQLSQPLAQAAASACGQAGCC